MTNSTLEHASGTSINTGDRACPTADRSSAERFAGLLGRFFPIAAWLLACCFLLGRWGMTGDDYSVGVVDPVTGEYNWSLSPWRIIPYFWRPLLMIEWHYLHSWFWRSMWVLHLLSAVFHGATAWVLSRVVVRTGADRRTGVIAALLFVVYPMNFEVVYWATAASIIQAALVWLALVLLTVRYAEVGGWWRLVVGGIAAFTVPCLYEQPMSGFPMLAMLSIGTLAGRVPWKPLVLRSLAMTAVSGLAGIGYTVLLIVTTPPDRRGSGQSMISPSLETLAARFSSVAHDVQHRAGLDAMRQVIKGGLKFGWTALGSTGGVLAFCGLVGLAMCWVLFSRSEPQEAAASREEINRSRPWRSVWMIACGLGIAALSFLPTIAVQQQPVWARNLYFPAIGVLLALSHAATLVFLLERKVGIVPVAAFLVRGATAAAVLVGAVIGVGWQANYRTITAADAEAVSLKAALPNPPAGLLLVPLADRNKPVNTGNILFDAGVTKWSIQPWWATSLTQHTYRRRDLFMTGYNPWAPPIMLNASPEGFRFAAHVDYLAEPDARGGSFVRWSKIIPFIVNAGGSVALVDRVIVPSPDGLDVVANLTQVAPLASGEHAARLVSFTQQADLTPPGSTSLGGWVLPGLAQPSNPASSWAWGTPLPVPSVRVAPREAAGMVLQSERPIPDGARRVLIRVTIDEGLIASCTSCAGLSLRAWVGDSAEASVATARVDPKEIAKDKRWLPVLLDLGPEAAGKHVAVEVKPDSADSPAILLSTAWALNALREAAPSAK